MADQKREAALRHIMATVQLDQSRGAFGMACARAGYDAALADNEEEIKSLKQSIEQIKSVIDKYSDSETFKYIVNELQKAIDE